MRWIFLLLVALNIFYFVWTQQQSSLLTREGIALELAESTSKNIQLLSENRKGETGGQPVQGEPGMCIHLGGFDEESRAAQLRQRLISLDIPAQQATIRAEFARDYWVYLPPFGSRDAALRQFRELQARGLDSYLITEGDLDNGISLGIFSMQDSADRLLTQMRALGYAAEVRELVRERREYWVRIPDKARPLLSKVLTDRLAADFPGLRQQLLSCSATVAPE